MKEIKFLLIGDQNVDFATLMDTYLWKVNFGYAYHDHLIKHIRYQITLQKISTCAQLQKMLPLDDSEIIYICLICFSTNPSEIFYTDWLYEIMDIISDVCNQIFLVALNRNLGSCFLSKLFLLNTVERKDILNVCHLHFKGKFKYLECSNFEVNSVRKLFDTAVYEVLYNNSEQTVNWWNNLQFLDKNRTKVFKYNKLLQN